MTKLSVNINKIALLRNSRGGNYPDLLQVAKDCERFGADGITVHPRPDERHVRYADLQPLKNIVTTEFNIEGYPDEKFMQKVLEVKPHQCTLVPDAPGQITSDHGWNTKQNKALLTDVIAALQKENIRVSLFIDADNDMIAAAKICGADRIEFYTGPYAHDFSDNKANAIKPLISSCEFAVSCGLGINAGHDLNLHNLKYFKQNMPKLDEVSIGHALFSDAIYFGLENTIRLYKRCLE